MAKLKKDQKITDESIEYYLMHIEVAKDVLGEDNQGY